MGEDHEGEARSEKASYARDAEYDTKMETGTLILNLTSYKAHIEKLQLGHGRGWPKWPK